MKTCFLFPGQGAQFPGMGKDLYESSATIRSLFSTVSDIVGFDMTTLLFESDEQVLKATDKAQPAITLVNVAASMALEDRGILPDSCAGHSLGEYSALWRAGVLALEDLFAVVNLRGRVMEEASRNLDNPNGSPGMTAVVGLDIEDIRKAIIGLEDKVFVANHNAPIQTVLAGSFEGLEQAEQAVDEAGAMQVVRLKVSGPFHSPLMQGARDAFAEELAGFTFMDPVIPVFSNVTGEILTNGEEAKANCLEQITGTVRWVDDEERVLESGAQRILEVGPGTVLRGLWKSFYKKIKCQPAGTIEAIEALNLEH